MEIFQFNLYTLIYALTTMVSLLVLFVAWINRKSDSGAYFFLLIFAVFIWSLFSVFEISALDLNYKILFSKVSYIGITTVPVFLFIFSAYYNGLSKVTKPKFIWIFFVIPIISNFLIFNTDKHGLIWSNITLASISVPGVNILVYEYGFWFWFLHLPYSYLLVILSIFLFVRSFFIFGRKYFRQSLTILIGLSLPFLANFAYVVGFNPLEGIDITVISFAFACVLFAIAIFYWSFLDLLPVARSLIIERMTDGVLVIDREKRVIDVNPFARKIVGIDEKYFGKNIDKVFPYWSEMEKIILSKENIGMIFVKEKNIYLQISVNFLYNQKGDIFAYLLVLQDVTKQKKLEESLREERDRAENYLNVAGVIFLVLDTSFNIKLINKRGLKILGYEKEEELLGKNWVDNFIPSNHRRNVKLVFADIFSGKSNLFEYNENYIIDKNGQERIISWHNTVLKDKDGKMVGILSSGEDITERKRIEEELKNKHNQIEAVIDSTMEGVLAIDNKGGVILYNNRFLELWNIPRELADKHDNQILLDFVLKQLKNPKEFLNRIKDLSKSNKKSNDLIYFKDGRIFERYSSTFVLNNSKDLGRVWSFRDITEKIESEQELQESEKRYRNLTNRFRLAVESASIGVWELDLATMKFTWDDQMYKIYNINKKIFDGSYSSWKKCVHPDDLGFIESEHKKSIDSGKRLDIVFRVISLNGNEKYISSFAEVIKNNKGKVIKMVGVNIDITKDKEMEIAKSEFVSLASHQLRTPLTSMHWYAEILLSEESGRLNKEQKKYLQEIEANNRYMISLINSLLNVSRLEMGTFIVDPRLINVVDLSKKVIDDYQSIIKERKIKFYSRFSKEIPKIKVDKRLFVMVLQSLISNAINYTPDKGRGKISFSISVNKKKDVIVLKVKDNGLGIPKKQKDKIFSKLFRADNVKRSNVGGSGLGLYLSKAIIDHAGGEIWFKSQLNKGSIFYFSLPLKGMKKKTGSRKLT